ncbi:porin [Xanthobacter sp. DSM 24535]|uniref:porin n=1 Tax=Roseixanthobacter psychrophilus TaxID=3119917 RepID=UPI0037289DCB
MKSGRAFAARRGAGLQTALWLAVLLGSASAAAAAEATPGKTGGNPCAQFGAGFQRAPGSDTCIKVGGAVRVDGGTGTTAGNAPNAGSSSTSTTGNPGPAIDPWKPAN